MTTHIEIQRARRARSQLMLADCKAGYTLQQIGDKWRMTREAVRQFLAELKYTKGSQAIRNAFREAILENKVRDNCMKRWGISKTTYKTITNKYNGRLPFKQFGEQRRTSQHRGIEFNLTFAEWWNFWQSSGHYEERGKGKGYVMARFKDQGPYAPGNIYICTQVQNCKDRVTDLKDNLK